MIKPTLAVVGLIIAMGIAGNMDVQEEERQHAEYCEMVQLWKQTNGKHGWPAYNGEGACAGLQADTIAILRQFNEWRQGDEDLPQPDPKQIAEAIDAAVEMIERMDGALESLLIRCDDSDSAMYGTLSTSFVRDTVRIARGEQE